MENGKTVLKGDVVKLFGSKIKIYVVSDQNACKRMEGFSDKGKIYRFTYDQISQIVRNKKTIYQLMEE